MSAIFKILLSFVFFFNLFNFNSAISKEYKKCNNFNSLNYNKSVNYIPVDKIDIKIDTKIDTKNDTNYLYGRRVILPERNYNKELISYIENYGY